MSIIDTLIFDRTAADVQRVANLAAAAQKRELTAAELDMWNASVVRGAYNAEDLNRVGEAALFVDAYLTEVQPTVDAYIAALGVADDALFDAGIAGPAGIAPRLDFARDDAPIIYADVTKTMQAASAVSARVGIALSVDVTRMTYNGANDVERALYDAFYFGENAINTRKDKADRIASAWYHGGDLFCGDLS